MNVSFQYASPIALGVSRIEFNESVKVSCYLLEFTLKFDRIRLMLGGCVIRYGESACFYPKKDIQYTIQYK